jgi:hypothetical protein
MTFWLEVAAGLLSTMFAATLLVICYIAMQWFLHVTDIKISYAWKFNGAKFYPDFLIQNRSKSRTYLIANIAYFNGSVAPIWVDNDSLWGYELKPGSLNRNMKINPAKNVNSLEDCLRVRVNVRLQTGRQFWLTGQGPGQEGKVVMSRIQRMAFGVRDFFEKKALSLDT